MAAKGQSTIGTYLYVGIQSANTLVYIKSYPDLMGSPDNIEVTDCDDDSQKFVTGVKTGDAIEFTANFLQDVFDDLNTMIETADGDDLHFKLLFGSQGAYGSFEWEGQMGVRISGGDVNSAREMVVVSYPSTEIEDTTVLDDPSFAIVPQNLEISLADGPVIINIDANYYTGATWISMDPEVATVADIGNEGRLALVTPVAAGETMIEADPTVPSHDPEFILHGVCYVTVTAE